jgi:hypothetical protein
MPYSHEQRDENGGNFRGNTKKQAGVGHACRKLAHFYNNIRQKNVLNILK